MQMESITMLAGKLALADVRPTLSLVENNVGPTQSDLGFHRSPTLAPSSEPQARSHDVTPPKAGLGPSAIAR
jgi:hypothetical protein